MTGRSRPAGPPALLLLLAALAAPGCGYRGGPIAGGDGRSIEVRFFTNETYRRELHRDLSRHVAAEIRSRSGYRLADPSGSPDLVLEGALVDVDEDVLSERGRGEIRESSVTLRARVVLRNARTGEAVAGPFVAESRRAFAPVMGESLRTAEEAAMKDLAEKIVYSLAESW